MSAISDNHRVEPADPPAPKAAGDEETLQLLTRHVLQLGAHATIPPSTVRAAIGEVVVEVGWAAPTGPGPAGARPTAGSTTDPVAPVPTQRPDPPRPTDLPSADGPESEVRPICAGTVGVFYRAPEPGAAPFVQVGDVVAVGQQVALIEAMKLMVPVEADTAGRVTEVLVDDGTAVEHGQSLFALSLDTADEAS